MMKEYVDKSGMQPDEIAGKIKGFVTDYVKERYANLSQEEQDIMAKGSNTPYGQTVRKVFGVLAEDLPSPKNPVNRQMDGLMRSPEK